MPFAKSILFFRLVNFQCRFHARKHHIGKPVYISNNMEASLEGEGTTAPFKSTQACDKDTCLVRLCFLQYFIRQCQSGEHGRKLVRLDLILVMVCQGFWVWDLHIRGVFPWNHNVVGHTGKVLGWCWPETKCGKNRVDHRSPATIIFDYFDWGRSQGKGKGSGSQMVGLYVVCTCFIKMQCWRLITIFFTNKCVFFVIYYFEPKNVHQKQNKIL